MAYLFLISGGSASGKSAYAEDLAVRLRQEGKNGTHVGAKMIYAATMHVYGQEDREKIMRHRELRAGKGFLTVEQPLDIGVLPAERGDIVLVEDLANLLANEMYDGAGAHENCVEYITEGICALRERGCHVVCVSCEVFADGIVYDESTQKYIEYLGTIHQNLAAEADFVAESVCGIPVIYKDMRFSSLFEPCRAQHGGLL